MLSEREIEREVRALTAHLSVAGRVLRRQITGRKRRREWCVVSHGTRELKKHYGAGDELVEVMLDRGWLEAGADGALLLTEIVPHADPAGRARETVKPGRCIGSRMIDGEDGRRRAVAVNHAESPLSWMRRRRGRDGRALLDWQQFEAGERLRRDFEQAGLGPKLTSQWGEDRPARSRRARYAVRHGSASDAALDARQRFAEALETVGPELADILVNVCCFLHGIEEAESANGWPRRSAKVVLQLALTRLARHYGLSQNARHL